eukprot:16451596-Heterocapsa_arctica.AAC.1
MPTPPMAKPTRKRHPEASGCGVKCCRILACLGIRRRTRPVQGNHTGNPCKKSSRTQETQPGLDGVLMTILAWD